MTIHKLTFHCKRCKAWKPDCAYFDSGRIKTSFWVCQDCLTPEEKEHYKLSLTEEAIRQEAEQKILNLRGSLQQ